MKIQEILSTRTGHKKINTIPMRRTHWGAGDYCVYYSADGNCNFYFTGCPYTIEGSLNYEDLIAEDWEIFEPVL